MAKVSFDQDRYHAGDIVRAVLTLNDGEKKHLRSIEATLICQEVRHDIENKILDKYDLDRRAEMGIPLAGNMITYEVVHSQVVHNLNGVVTDIPEGKIILFKLPEDAVDTSLDYGDDRKTYAWKSDIKIDVPLAFDKHLENEIIVGDKCD